tara:strand:+ start:1295 stop:1975 length:681 start_codon:yes stop_codon:yes gene_type:complete
MKKLILTTLLMGAAMVGAVKATTIADVSAEGGISFSNLSTSNGLAVREDTTNYSLTLGTAVADGDLSVGIGLAEGDGNTDTDISVSWGRPVNILGQDLAGVASFKKIESSYGGWEQLGLGLTYSDALADVTATVWHQLGSSASYGVELTVSKDLELFVDNLTTTPFVTANLANDYNSVEIGVALGYDIGNGLSVGAKASYLHNDADGTLYELDHDWGVSAGLSYKF